MKRPYLYALLIALTAGAQSVKAENEKGIETDTIKTYALNEVVVTSSTKETNDMRTLPGAISILSPRMINNRQIEALKDISTFAPNVYMPDYGSKMTSAIYIRGIGARSSGQTVGLYVDNVPYMDKSTFDFELTDIQRIEVLRGPQGTLYGRNAMGGIINVYTLSPIDYQGTRLSVSAGNYGQVNAKASHYHKLGETVGISLGGYYDRNDGYFTNAYTGEKADHEEAAGGRLKLDWRIRPNLLATYSTNLDYTDQGAFPYGIYDPQTKAVASVNYNDPGAYQRTVWTNNLSFEYKTDRFLLSSTTGYQYFKDDMKMDQDYTPRSLFTLNQKQKQQAFSEELAIKSNTQSNYQWSVGMYGFYDDLHTEGPVTFKKDGINDIFQRVFDNLKAANPRMPITLTVMNDELVIPGVFETPTYGLALFHQSTYNNLFIKGLSITAGLRLDYEKQKLDYQSSGKMKLGMSFDPATPPTDISSMYPESVIDESISQDYWQVLPKVALKYECTPRTVTYLSAAKGYKAGGYNVQMSADVMQTRMQYDVMNAFKNMIPTEIKEPAQLDEVAAYKPEQSWNYELGVRSELVPSLLQGELTLFYMDIKDIQLTKFVDSGSGRILTNAGKARSYGAEASLRATIADGLTADVNYGYTHATFRDYNNGEEDFSGNYIPYAPRHTVSVGLQNTRLFRNSWIDQFTIGIQYNGAGDIYWTERNDITQPFYALLNAKAGIRKGIVSLNLWGRNLTDTQYAAFYFDTSKYDGTKDRQPFMQLGKPLQIGAEVIVTF